MARICPLMRISSSCSGGPFNTAKRGIISSQGATGKLVHAVVACRLGA